MDHLPAELIYRIAKHLFKRARDFLDTKCFRSIFSLYRVSKRHHDVIENLVGMAVAQGPSLCIRAEITIMMRRRKTYGITKPQRKLLIDTARNPSNPLSIPRKYTGWKSKFILRLAKNVVIKYPLKVMISNDDMSTTPLSVQQSDSGYTITFDSTPPIEFEDWNKAARLRLVMVPIGIMLRWEDLFRSCMNSVNPDILILDICDYNKNISRMIKSLEGTIVSQY